MPFNKKIYSFIAFWRWDGWSSGFMSLTEGQIMVSSRPLEAQGLFNISSTEEWKSLKNKPIAHG